MVQVLQNTFRLKSFSLCCNVVKKKDRLKTVQKAYPIPAMKLNWRHSRIIGKGRSSYLISIKSGNILIQGTAGHLLLVLYKLKKEIQTLLCIYLLYGPSSEVRRDLHI